MARRATHRDICEFWSSKIRLEQYILYNLPEPIATRFPSNEQGTSSYFHYMTTHAVNFSPSNLVNLYDENFHSNIDKVSKDLAFVYRHWILHVNQLLLSLSLAASQERASIVLLSCPWFLSLSEVCWSATFPFDFLSCNAFSSALAHLKIIVTVSCAFAVLVVRLCVSCLYEDCLSRPDESPREMMKPPINRLFWNRLVLFVDQIDNKRRETFTNSSNYWALLHR